MEILQQNDKEIRAKFKNCEIYINLLDFLKIYKKYPPNAFDDTPIIYINEFICRLKPIEKSNGRKLLGMILEHIQNTYFKSKIVFVSLFAISMERIDSYGNVYYSDNQKLVQYYSKLGFRVIDQEGIMLGRMNDIMIKCDSQIGGKKYRSKRRIS